MAVNSIDRSRESRSGSLRRARYCNNESKRITGANRFDDGRSSMLVTRQLSERSIPYRRKSSSVKTIGSCNSNKTNVEQRRVQFSFVMVREYEQTITDHPCVSEGPGIGIGWIYRGTSNCSVDDYEYMSSGGGFYPPTNEHQLALSREDREDMLCRLGYTRAEMASSVREIRKAKSARRTTIHNLGMAGVEEALEGVKKSIIKKKNMMRIMNFHDSSLRQAIGNKSSNDKRFRGRASATNEPVDLFHGDNRFETVDGLVVLSSDGPGNGRYNYKGALSTLGDYCFSVEESIKDAVTNTLEVSRWKELFPKKEGLMSKTLKDSVSRGA